MSGYGRVNLLVVMLMPAIATLTGIIMFGPKVDTMIAIYGMNLVPMLIGGLISGALLRGAGKFGGVGRWITLWPTVLTAVVGIAWYVRDALFPDEQDPGRMYLAVPIYMLVIVVFTGMCAWGACAIVRSRRASA